MTIAIILAALTAISTLAGGALALKAKNRLHLVLGLSAGLLLGLVAFDLLPEVFELGTQEFLHAPIVSIAPSPRHRSTSMPAMTTTTVSMTPASSR